MVFSSRNHGSLDNAIEALTQLQILAEQLEAGPDIIKMVDTNLDQVIKKNIAVTKEYDEKGQPKPKHIPTVVVAPVVNRKQVIPSEESMPADESFMGGLFGSDEESEEEEGQQAEDETMDDGDDSEMQRIHENEEEDEEGLFDQFESRPTKRPRSDPTPAFQSNMPSKLPALAVPRQRGAPPRVPRPATVDNVPVTLSPSSPTRPNSSRSIRRPRTSHHLIRPNTKERLVCEIWREDCENGSETTGRAMEGVGAPNGSSWTGEYSSIVLLSFRHDWRSYDFRRCDRIHFRGQFPAGKIHTLQRVSYSLLLVDSLADLCRSREVNEEVDTAIEDLPVRARVVFSSEDVVMNMDDLPTILSLNFDVTRPNSAISPDRFSTDITSLIVNGSTSRPRLHY